MGVSLSDYASPTKRSISYIIDMAVLFGVLFLLDSLPFDILKNEIFYSVAFEFIFDSYFIILIGLWGATLGNSVMDIKVVDASKSAISFKQSFFRYLPYIIVGLLLLYSEINAEFAYSLEESDNPILLGNPNVIIIEYCILAIVCLFGLFDVLSIVSSPKRQSLCDIWAGTVVVEKSRAN